MTDKEKKSFKDYLAIPDSFKPWDTYECSDLGQNETTIARLEKKPDDIRFEVSPLRGVVEYYLKNHRNIFLKYFEKQEVRYENKNR